MNRSLLALLIPLSLTVFPSCADGDDSGVELARWGTCSEQEADCCCPIAGTGIDCMPAISECTQWKLETCDVYCASY